jgi:hypothetical protein
VLSPQVYAWWPGQVAGLEPPGDGEAEWEATSAIFEQVRSWLPSGALWALLLLALVSGCVRTSTASLGASAQAYSQALRAGDLEQAYARTTPQFREQTSFEAFSRALSTSGSREAKADALDAALEQLARAAPELGASLSPSHGPAEVLSRFLSAAEQGDFKAAYALLSARWRAHYTPERLAADFAREPLAKERLARARLALSRGPQAQGDETLFPLGDGNAVVLRREEDGYRVASLE